MFGRDGRFGRGMDGRGMCFAAPFAVSDISDTEDVEKMIISIMKAPTNVIIRGAFLLEVCRGYAIEGPLGYSFDAISSVGAYDGDRILSPFRKVKIFL